MKKIILLFCLTFLCVKINAQCDDQIYLNSQADVDNFFTDYFDCLIPLGEELFALQDQAIVITGDDITNLYGLLMLERIEDGSLAFFGSLHINCPNLESLEGLSSLTYIENELFLDDCYALTSLSGLANLTYCQGLSIHGCNALQDLSGLEQVEDINYGLSLSANTGLTSLNGLGATHIDYISLDYCPSLTDFTGLESLLSCFSLEINECLGLENLSGLENAWGISMIYLSHNLALTNITALEGNIDAFCSDIYIENNPSLSSLEGLSSLTSVDFILDIRDNDNLVDLSGLDNLNFVETLSIAGNTNLQSLNGLEALNNVTEFSIAQNQSLQNLSGLDNLDGVGFLSVSENNALVSLDGLNPNLVIFLALGINGNAQLSDIASIALPLENFQGIAISVSDNTNLSVCCSLLPILTDNPSSISISNNAGGCNSNGEIIISCSNFSVQAFAFFDENENGILDGGEQGIFNQNIAITPNELLGFTNNEGMVIFALDGGIYDISINTSPLWESTNGITSVNINAADDNGIIYFPLTPIAEFGILSIDLTSSITRCFQETTYWLTYTNEGTIPSNGVVSLAADELTEFVSANPPADSIANDTLYWFYEDLAPTHSEQIALVYQMPGVEAIGTYIDFEVQIDDIDGSGSDKATLRSDLVCAYDPNDKLAVPAGVGNENYTLFGDTMTYTIRFQNTGNDTAFNVVIHDTLSPFLDINSFRPVSSSHTLVTEVDLDTRIVSFYFNDIYLADSFVNEPASHGFVKFDIETLANIGENTVIENTAGIFFDFNPAIVTNTVNNTFVSSIPLDGFELNTKVYLEGCYDNNDVMTAVLGSLIPNNQVFNSAPWNHFGNETLSSIPINMVDWVLVEMRQGTPNLSGSPGTTVVESKAGILLDNGAIVSSDGSLIRFTNLSEGEAYYIAIRHRNHLDILSADVVVADAQMNYDFTSSANMAFGFDQQKTASDGKAMMIAGDANADGIIQVSDYDIWFTDPAVLEVYGNTDFNLDGIIQVTDFDKWFANKAKVGIVEFQN